MFLGGYPIFFPNAGSSGVCFVPSLFRSGQRSAELLSFILRIAERTLFTLRGAGTLFKRCGAAMFPFAQLGRNARTAPNHSAFRKPDRIISPPSASLTARSDALLCYLQNTFIVERENRHSIRHCEELSITVRFCFRDDLRVMIQENAAETLEEVCG